MKIESSAFKSKAFIPQKYTGEGLNISPPLEFSDVPKAAQSLVLIMDDPDASGGTFDHWICWFLPSTTQKLGEGEEIDCVGINSYNFSGYKGPFPPPGKPHRYFFKLYALNIELKLTNFASKPTLEKVMKDHIIEQAELIGIYEVKS